ncbi:MAG TPA: flagellar export chaperone FliS [Solirubrobacteraceae bacterium]|jgi:flagellar protein FliS|nr:flagellar export chaperone FliS [Solirubrobacteraceae bacterium]
MTPPTASPQAYRENAVLSATPEQLVVMLYDGARRFLRQAGKAMRAGEVESAHNALRRAEMIVAHLDGVLDYELGEPIASQLHPIYRFCLTHLGRARIEQDPGKVDEVGGLLGELRESWAEIAHG